MSVFERSKDQLERRLILSLLEGVEEDPKISQRTMSQELGIAFGLVNTYFKRCINKGWVRATSISPKRYLYFITPEGLAEKSRLVKDYLSYSMTFFRQAREQCEAAYQDCKLYNWQKIALLGNGELAEIAELSAQGYELEVLVVENADELPKFDAVLITDIIEPQQQYDAACEMMHPKKVIALDVLHVCKKSSDKRGVA